MKLKYLKESLLSTSLLKRSFFLVAFLLLGYSGYGQGITVSAISGNTTEAGVTAEFTIVLDSEPTADVTIPLSSSDTSEGDLGLVTGVTFTQVNWATAQTVTVIGIDDAVVDGDVVYSIVTGDPASLDLGYAALTAGGVADVSITNTDDDVLGITVSAISGNTTEAGVTAEFTIVLDSEPTADVTIPLSSSDTSEGDLGLVTGVTFTQVNWATAQTVTVIGIDDAVVDGDVVYSIVTGDPASLDLGYAALTAGGVADVSITNTDDDVSVVSIDNPVAITEGDVGSSTIDYTVSIDQSDPVSNITVDYTISGGNEDGTVATLTFLAGTATLTQTISVTTTGDTTVESDELITVTLSNPSANVTLSVTNAIGTSSFTNDDAVLVSFSSASSSDLESSGANLPTLFITGTVTASSSVAVSDLGTGSATGGGVDYNFVGGVLVNIPAGVYDGTSATQITIPGLSISDDGMVEATETIDLSLILATGDATIDVPVTTTYSILDDDSSNIVVNDPTPVLEGDSGTATLIFEVTLTQSDPVNPVTVDYLINGGIEDGNSGTLTFLPATTNLVQTISVTTAGDTTIETDEAVTVTLSNQSVNATISKALGASSFTNDDTCDSGTVAPVLDTSISTFFCDVINQDLDEYVNGSAPSGTTLIWSIDSDPLNDSAHLVNTVVAAPGTYYGFFYSDTDLCASPVLSVSLVVNFTPTINATSGDERCGLGMLTLTAESSLGGTLNWYENEFGGSSIETGETFVTPELAQTTSYYVSTTANGCTSERVEVVATVNIQPTAGTGTDGFGCNLSGNGRITTLDLDIQLSGSDAGDWAITTDPSGGSISIDNNNVVDFENLPDGDYIFTYTTNTAAAPCVNESVSVTISVSDCIDDSDGDGINDEDEEKIGTNPDEADSDGDGITDDIEVGSDLGNPLDEDADGIIDALDSNIVDTDSDGVVDQKDPANDNPCVPDNTVGQCDTDNDGISDGDEIANGSDPLDACDPNFTPDCMPDEIDLSVEKEADVAEARVGDTVVFTITLTNLTGDKILDIEVQDLIQDAIGFSYVAHNASIGAYNVNTGVWTIDELLTGAVNTLEITTEVLEMGTHINNVAIIASFPADFDDENDNDSVEILVRNRTTDECGFLFNQFSPNGDGTNDFLRINCIENYPGNFIQIYDRYGNIVFEKRNYDNSWDGTWKDGNLPKGTYYYILDLADGSVITKGWIQLIR